jgi:formylglycine-generating enzyme required for sulfatase activity
MRKPKLTSPISGRGLLAGLLALGLASAVQAASPVISGLSLVPGLTIQSDTNVINEIQFTNRLSQGNWATLTSLVVTQSPYWFADLSATSAPARFYRVVSVAAPAGTALVPAGLTVQGDTYGDGGTKERPVHVVSVSAFCMDTNLVTYALWQQVYQWGANHS